MIDLRQDTPELLAHLKRALAARDAETAERIAEVVCVREPGHENVVAFLVARALARGEVLRALHVARGGVRARPESARLRFQHGLALAASGDAQAALEAFRDARGRDPDLLVAPLWQADCEAGLGRDEDALRSRLCALNLAERLGLLAPTAQLASPVRERLSTAVAAVQAARREAIEPALAAFRERHAFAPNERIFLMVDRAKTHIFDAATGQRL